MTKKKHPAKYATKMGGWVPSWQKKNHLPSFQMQVKGGFVLTLGDASWFYLQKIVEKHQDYMYLGDFFLGSL